MYVPLFPRQNNSNTHSVKSNVEEHRQFHSSCIATHMGCTASVFGCQGEGEREDITKKDRCNRIPACEAGRPHRRLSESEKAQAAAPSCSDFLEYDRHQKANCIGPANEGAAPQFCLVTTPVEEGRGRGMPTPSIKTMRNHVVGETCQRLMPMQWVSALSSGSSTLQEIHPGDTMSFSDISTGTMSHLSNNYARSAANSRSSKSHQASGNKQSASNATTPSKNGRQMRRHRDTSSSFKSNFNSVFLMSSSQPLLQIDHQANAVDEEGFLSATWGTQQDMASFSHSVAICTHD